MFETTLHAMPPASQPGTAAGQPAGAGGLMGMLFPILLMVAVFYFMLWRPQQKQAKERKAMLDALKKGDAVVTAGGIHGVISAVEGDIIMVEVAKGVELKVARSAVESKKA